MAINPNQVLSRMGTYGGPTNIFDQLKRTDEDGNTVNILSEKIRDRWYTPDQIDEEGNVTKAGHWGKYEGADFLKGQDWATALGNPFKKSANRIQSYLKEKRYDRKVGNIDNPVIQEAVNVAQESDTGDYTNPTPAKVTQPDWAEKDVEFMRTFHDAYGMADDKGGFQGMLEGKGGNLKNLGALMSTMKNMGYNVGDVSSDIAKHGWGAYGDKSHGAYQDIISKLGPRPEASQPEAGGIKGWWDRITDTSDMPKNPDGSPKVMMGYPPLASTSPITSLSFLPEVKKGAKSLWDWATK